MHTPPPDYNKENCWAIRHRESSRDFDIFYVYPTFYGGPAAALMDVYAIPPALAPNIKNNVLKNCGIFDGGGNIYAPFYRQASFASLRLPEAQKQEILKISLADIIAAFDHYLAVSGGRPFVLAGHSQGSRLLRELMKAKFNNAALSARLIAAYLLGAELTKSDLKTCPWLKLAAGADDFGIIITYNTQSSGVKHSPIYERGNSVCVNPLNWGACAADRSLNQGALFFGGDGVPTAEVKNFTGAYIEARSGALIAPDADVEKYSSPLFPRGVYHLFDYEFFYRNLQSNFKERLKAFLNAK
ncbi:MAG: DUF3089 domain-containing protein [Elusimicrobiota bacterium]|jgi:hypothetical protein|nr:DUF3089 domain-containing protein [Elusimicrobiota bacterium]